MDKNVELTELQKKHQEQMKERREAIKQRKARTHRLIVRGAIAEKVIPNAESMTDEQFQKALYQAIDKGDIATCHPQDSHGSVPRKSPSEDPAEQLSAERTHHTNGCDV